MKHLLVFALLLNIYDALITLHGVHNLGLGEMNPLLAEMVVDEPLKFLLVKNAVFLLVLAFLALGLKYTRKYARRLIIFLFSSLLLVCIWNSYLVVCVAQ